MHSQVEITPDNIDDLLSEKDFLNVLSSESATIVPALKNIVETINNGLKSLYQDGAPVEDIVHGRSKLIDRFLITLFNFLFKDEAQTITLIAVGGYGRGELHPGSDIDLMILLEKEENTNTKDIIENFLALLWDSKLEIGHSVRTLDECIAEAEKDTTIATNIMEARLLCGNNSLFITMKEKTGPEHLWNSQDFFQAKLDEQIQRSGKFNDTAYNLEPNIKESHGGLRDIQMIGWVAKRHFGADHMIDLVDHGFLQEDEYKILIVGQNLLWKIRCSLHYLSGRREDRLLFDYQRQLATEFGYLDDETGKHNNQAIEQFMQNYYRTVIELEQLNEMLLQHFREAILYAKDSIEPSIINEDFQSRHGYIEVIDKELFEKKPTALLDIFYVMQLNPELQGVRAETIRLIRNNRHLINDEFRSLPEAKTLFIKIISQSRGITHELRRMNRYGILANYIPAFGFIVGRMQYDLFHSYTVDQHTLFVVRNLRRLAVPDFCHEFPLASGIIHHIKKPHLLYIAGLFHDIAKGRNGDHSELGAIDALEFCLAHNLKQSEAKLVSWLVKNHLIMSMTSQRKDISDPEVISEFADNVSDLERLDALYLLTLADIRATNPKQWNSWRDNLLIELYNKTAEVLHLGVEYQTTRQENVQQNITSALRILDQKGISAQKTNELWQYFNDSYFLHHTPDELVWHTQSIFNLQSQDKPLVLCKLNSKTSSMDLLVYCKSKDNLFAAIVTSLGSLDLNIVNAQIMLCSNGNALETFKIISNNNDHDTLNDTMHDIVPRIQNILQESNYKIPNITVEIPRLHKHFDLEKTVDFESSHDKTKTRVNITTIDRPGILSIIAKTLLSEGVRIHGANISTAGEKATDHFYVTSILDDILLTEEQQSTLKKSLLEKI